MRHYRRGPTEIFRIIACAVALCGAIAGHSPASAAENQPLAGKTIRFVVGYAPGGGFDTYARMLAPKLQEKTGATVVVDNRPGGGGQTATNQMMREKPDGLTQYLINGVPAVLGQIVKKAGMDYDLQKFTWLGRVNAETWAVMVNKDTPYQTIGDLAKAGKPITFAALSRADGPSDGAATLCEALKIKCRIVLGFQGTSEASLAVIRGEAEAIIMTDTSVFERVQEGQARAIGVLGSRRSGLFPDMKSVSEQVQLTDDGKFWNQYRANIADVGRSVIAPPGMDPQLAEYLRGVWTAILTDEQVVAEGKKVGRVIDFIPGTEAEALVKSIFGGELSSRAKDVEDVLLKRYFE